MVKDIQLVANDLKLYFRGFEVALNKSNIDDSIRYLKDIRRELNDNLDYLQAKQEASEVQDVLKRILKESLGDYKKRIRRIEKELKRH
ncbi:hypothetical protein [Nitrososphaera sp.]|uniref:hypothetical protein n=1 Tax=Nitrososphaera sp. TaxID=1971748 RepID=UPI002EDA6872